MSQNERLRETLIELEIVRDREREALAETKALLEILEVATQSGDPKGALLNALKKAAESLDAQRVALGKLSDGTLSVSFSTAFEDELSFHIQNADYFRKSRNVIDLSKIEGLDEDFRKRYADQRSLLFAVANDNSDAQTVLLCFDPQPGKFSNKNLRFLKRLVGLFGQVSNNLELSIQNDRLAAVIDGSSSGFAIADATQPDLPLIYVNQAFETLSGYSASEVLGKNCRFLSAEAPQSPERSRLRAAVKDRTAGTFLIRNKRKNGEEFWNDLALFPVYDHDGNLAQLVATQTDATERVESIEQTRIAEARLQEVLEHTRDAFLMLMPDKTIGFCNDSTRTMFPSPVSKWGVGTSFDENWSAYIEGLPKSFQNISEQMRRPDFHQLSEYKEGVRSGLPDGRQVLFRAQITSEGATVISATDTTALRNTERLLKQRAAAVENASDGIGITDFDGRVVYSNSKMAQLLGFESELLLTGRKWQRFYRTPENEDRLKAEVGMSDRGRIFERALGDAGQYHEVSQTDLEKVGSIVVIRDVTTAVGNRQRMAALNAQIESTRRREAISELAAGVAHDFNNVLSAISGSATLIVSEPDATEDQRQHANRILKAGNTAARLVNRLLDLGADAGDAGIFDLRSILSEVEGLAASNLGSNVTLSFDKPDFPMNIRGVNADISLVILNLILNANDAFEGAKGTIEVALRTFEPSSNTQPIIGENRPGQSYFEVVVEDTAGGIPADVLNKIFEPYFSTKGNRGTGVGLAMVSAIVQRLDGFIIVDTQEGQGTAFHVAFPRIEDNDFADGDDAALVDLTGKTILVLDDEQAVAGVIVSFLESCGAEVSVVDDPSLAIEVLMDDPDDWDCLITDYDMPGLTGGDVIEQLRGQGMQIPIFVVTALARRLADPRLNKPSIQGLFAKPVNLGQLAQEVAQGLFS